MNAFDEYSVLRRVMLRSPVTVFGNEADIARQWRALNFTAPPDPGLAREQYAVLRGLMTTFGAQVDECPPDEALTLDAIYVRDASILTPRGVVLCRMGKPARRGEPAAQGRFFQSIGIPVLGEIQPPAHIEGGDVLWFDPHTVAVGRGYRTNDEGIAQFKALVGDEVDVVVVPLPHHRGQDDVFHLMSILSPIDEDLAVVFSPLMPVPFREWLERRGIDFVEVPPEEFESMGGNVFALGPRQCVMLDGNPATRARLEAAGAEVHTYDGSEISVKGGGGPTCLTRPLRRGAAF